jgi:hypothetical protein
VFVMMMVIGLVGLSVMAIPAFGHRHAPSPHGGPTPSGHGAAAHHGLGAHAGGHAAHAGAHAVHAGAHGPHAGASGPSRELVPADAAHGRNWRFIPSPRAIFSVLALYGAFGNALVHAAHLGMVIASLVAVAPALLVEQLVVKRVWNLVFRFQGVASSPLEALIFADALAVVPFRNGRGLVSTVRDGRSVQLVAELRKDQAMLPVKVGARLRIEDVDASRERVTVSVLRD